MTSQGECIRSCCSHPSCKGPAGPFAPSVYFQVAVNAPITPIPAAAALIPLDTVLANVGAIFDATFHAFIAPFDGPYRFEYTIVLQASNASAVQVLAEVGSLFSMQPVPQFSSITSLAALEVETLTGSVVINLLQGQAFSLTAASLGGGTCQILGPESATPPYPSILSVYSLF